MSAFLQKHTYRHTVCISRERNAGEAEMNEVS